MRVLVVRLPVIILTLVLAWPSSALSAPLVTLFARAGLGGGEGVAGGAGTGRLSGTGACRFVDASPDRVALEAVPGYWAARPNSARRMLLKGGGDVQAEAGLDGQT